MKNLADLQAECASLGIKVETTGRLSKEPFILVLRDHHWPQEHPGKPLPPQFFPMLLCSWDDLNEDEVREIEEDCHAWIIQPKFDGVRALLHIEDGQVRITSRCISEVTYRLSEFQANLPHLTQGISQLSGTILDGELVCSQSVIDTGSSITESSLQATTTILATSPEKARKIQEQQDARVQFHVFDILRFQGQELTSLPLMDRQDILAKVFQAKENPFLELVPSSVVGKAEVHRRIIEGGGEGTVWKKVNAPYEPGRRVGHWIKRKRGIEVEAFVTGFKPGNNGHTGLVGAVEFGVKQSNGSTTPIAWVSSFLDAERLTMTVSDGNGTIRLADEYLGKRAIISGQDLSSRSRRIRHARLVRWIDPVGP